MKRTQILTLALVLAIGLLAGLLTNLNAEPIYAQRPESKMGEKWEYSAITYVVTDVTYTAARDRNKVVASAGICYFQASGCRREVVEVLVDSANVSEANSFALAKATARLGEEGWAMLGEATQFGDAGKALYFRRQLK